jgi:hypothetical protein
MTTSEARSAVYAAYAELESAAEAFYTAAATLWQLVPSLKQQRLTLPAKTSTLLWLMRTLN